LRFRWPKELRLAAAGSSRHATLANGKEFEVGRITVWKPGERLALCWRHATFAPGQEGCNRFVARPSISIM
jgi:hypothetical protein